MSRKNVSAEEKRKRILELFYEKKEVFQLKELEQIAPKEKGVIAQSVNGVLQSLVDDGLVDTDKIGGSIYFWAFPSKALNSKKKTYEQLVKKLKEDGDKLESLKEKVEQAKQGKDLSDERAQVLQTLERLEKEEADLRKKLENCIDLEDMEMKRKEIKMYKEAINRWTDNIFTMKSWAKKKFGIEDKVLNKQFGIPEDLDYVDV